MRICLTCSAYYGDDSAPFCLVDGMPLVAVDPNSDKWREGSRRIKEKESALRKRKLVRSWQFVLLSALTLLIATVVVSQSVTVVRVPPPLFTISGQVKTENKPAGGVKIILEGEKTQSTETDPDGHYAFKELKGDRAYTITPDLPKTNFAPANQSFVKLTKDETADFIGKPQFYKIAGHVTEADVPVSGITIKLAGSTKPPMLTRADGSYDFSDLPAEGHYTVTPVGLNTKFTPPSFPVESLAHDEVADFSSLRFYVISGRVLSAGVPLNNITVTVTLAGAVIRSTRTKHGEYTFPDLPADGSYTVTPTATDLTFAPQSFPKLSHDEKANFSAKTDPDYQISGRVISGDAFLRGVRITLSGAKPGTFTTGADGYYVFPGLPAGGTYTVTASGPQANFPPQRIPRLLKNEVLNFLVPVRDGQTPFHLPQNNLTPTKPSRPAPARPRIENSNAPARPRP